MPFCRKAKRDKHCRERYMRAFPPVGGKCRCVYCGRWIPAKRIEVDHVIPVRRCAGSLLVRLFLCDFSNVNDVRNLRYACYQCNAKKRRFAERHLEIPCFRRNERYVLGPEKSYPDRVFRRRHPVHYLYLDSMRPIGRNRGQDIKKERRS